MAVFTLTGARASALSEAGLKRTFGRVLSDRAGERDKIAPRAGLLRGDGNVCSLLMPRPSGASVAAAVVTAAVEKTFEATYDGGARTVPPRAVAHEAGRSELLCAALPCGEDSGCSDSGTRDGSIGKGKGPFAAADTGTVDACRAMSSPVWPL